MSLCASVYLCYVVTCWERADLLALVCGVSVSFTLSHWFPESGVVLNCIDSLSLHPYLPDPLIKISQSTNIQILYYA